MSDFRSQALRALDLERTNDHNDQSTVPWSYDRDYVPWSDPDDDRSDDDAGE